MMLNIMTTDGPQVEESLGEVTLFGQRCFVHGDGVKCQFKVTEYTTGRLVGVLTLTNLQESADNKGLAPQVLLADTIAELLAQGGAVNQ